MWAGQAVELDSSTSFTKACCISANNHFNFQIIEMFPDSDWFKWTVPNPVWGSPGFFLFPLPAPLSLNYSVFLWKLVPRFLQGTSCFLVSPFLLPFSCKVGQLLLMGTLCHTIWERAVHFEVSCVVEKASSHSKPSRVLSFSLGKRHNSPLLFPNDFPYARVDVHTDTYLFTYT